jgi:bla regulator protein BlaR1
MTHVLLCRRSYRTAIQVVLLVAAQLGLTQRTSEPLSQSATPGAQAAKQPAFDVVSIRRSKPGEQGGVTWAIQPNGYRTSNQSIWYTIMIAYFPQGLAVWSQDRIKDPPAWVSNELYDINAKISADDLAAWQRQGKILDQQEMFRAMLKSMLADRCHLILHSIPGTTVGLVLQVGKQGPQFKPTPTNEAIPSEGMRFPEGGTVILNAQDHTARFYGVTMRELARFSSMFLFQHQPVEDQTGLSGRYDLIVHSDEPASSPSSSSEEDAAPPPTWDLQALGLEVKKTKVPIDTLVIDHIDRPSEN